MCAFPISGFHHPDPAREFGKHWISQANERFLVHSELKITRKLRVIELSEINCLMLELTDASEEFDAECSEDEEE